MKKMHLLIIFLFCILFHSCDQPVEDDEYFVKYEVTGDKYENDTGISVVIYNGDVSQFFICHTFPWEMIVGPVKKGFYALRVQNFSTSYTSDVISIAIYVSKNNGPFALKAYDYNLFFGYFNSF